MMIWWIKGHGGNLRNIVKDFEYKTVLYARQAGNLLCPVQDCCVFMIVVYKMVYKHDLLKYKFLLNCIALKPFLAYPCICGVFCINISHVFVLHMTPRKDSKIKDHKIKTLRCVTDDISWNVLKELAGKIN